MADGIIGNGTINTMNVSATFRLKQIAANLERLRWERKHTPTRYVEVNIPEYRLYAFNEGEKILDMRVVVGRDERQTPILEDRIVNLKFSPNWTVPTTIVEEDLLPKLREDPFYLIEAGYIAKQNGEYIDPFMVDWENATKYSVRFEKPAGATSPLGGVRFSLTNNFAIFLHDTNNRSYFNKDDRAQSSGCVRVADATALSHFLLNDEKTWPTTKIIDAMNSGQTRIVVLKESVPVKLSYKTAFVDNNGLLNFRSDIYDLDTALFKKLGLEL